MLVSLTKVNTKLIAEIFPSSQAYEPYNSFVYESIAIGLLSKCAKVLQENEVWTRWGVSMDS